MRPPTVTEPSASVLRSAWRDSGRDQRALLERLARIEHAIVVEVVEDGRVDHAALRQRLPRQSDAMARDRARS